MPGLYYHNILAQFSFGRVSALRCAWDAEARETLVAPAWDESLATDRTSRRPNSAMPLHAPVILKTAQKDDQRNRGVLQKAGSRNSD